jgi:hypothetical protein
MYANILLSTDGSEVAQKGIEQGIALAKALNAKITIITVTEPLPATMGACMPRDGFLRRQKLIALTQPARNARAKSSTRLLLWRNGLGYPQNAYTFQMRTRPLRLSKQPSPKVAT